MKRLLLGVAALALAGCSSVDTAREVIKDRGREFYDQLVDDSLYLLCIATSVDSVRREFGTSPERMEAYNTICFPARQTPLPPASVNGDGA